MPVTKEALDRLALSEAEYEAIVERLGREPNELELGLFGSLWSEHCGYKHSKPLLRLLPSESPRLMVEPGAENAGVVDIGDGLAIVMKIESHNHPSAIEPYQGAATGVGGIVRDIFAMGARPIALLNSLRFGPLTDARNRYLFEGVVSGISGYGNCIGIPNVGGEVVFSPSYSGNPLVNAMCVGLLNRGELVHSAAVGAGNLLMLVGADTGRDGIHGASGLASRTFEDDRELRPTVQVGNPFLEKVLIEACLEVARTDHFVGIQDLGAAGLTSAAVESASSGGSGIELDVAKIPRRDTDMTPYEVMLSESQERMLIIVKAGREDQVRAIFDKWDLQSTVIGRVTDDGNARIFDSDVEEGELPVGLLTDPPLYRLQGVKPDWMKTLQSYDLSEVPLPDEGPESILLRLLASPNIACKESVYRQYDHQVQTNTVIAPGGDAAVLRLKGTKKAIALATDGNGRICYLDPFVGGKIAVAEACRNISCVGAEPIALTDCLNFGNPERPEVYYQLEEVIKGMAEASRALDAPVISGNVSLYNEAHGTAIYPTPVIGSLGLLEDVEAHVDIGFREESHAVVLLGACAVVGTPKNLAGSEYLEVVHGLIAGRPSIDLDDEVRLQRACRALIRKGIIRSAHDCSDGGLAVAIAESCIAGNIGFQGDSEIDGRWDAALFGEAQSRIVVSLDADKLPMFEAICSEEGVDWCNIGLTGGDVIKWNEHLNIKLSAVEDAWRGGIERALAEPVDADVDSKST
ncbi:MAG: phosphoribosylformylglycinamidine synthase subunit PurL [Chloroflexi bacterium]|nr:phosphoribosylformylglycinamidine synthase subunit PurL [Chloroflexota bacterium]